MRENGTYTRTQEGRMEGGMEVSGSLSAFPTNTLAPLDGLRIALLFTRRRGEKRFFR